MNTQKQKTDMPDMDTRFVNLGNGYYNREPIAPMQPKELSAEDYNLARLALEIVQCEKWLESAIENEADPDRWRASIRNARTAMAQYAEANAAEIKPAEAVCDGKYVLLKECTAVYVDEDGLAVGMELPSIHTNNGVDQFEF